VTAQLREEVVAWIGARGWVDLPEHFIHPFNDPAGMAGTGTLALEVIDQVPEVRRLVVPVGGGGLASGVAIGLRAAGVPAEVIGVQSSGYPLWIRSLNSAAPAVLTPDTIADGTTAPFDESMVALLRDRVDRWVEVPEREVRRGVRELALAHKVVAEGAGALAYVAARMLGGETPTVAVVSGGNVDAGRLTELLTEQPNDDRPKVR
jgi:threonine dehydratase